MASLVKLCQWLAPNGVFTTTDLIRNVHEMSASLAKLLYHEKVLSAYHDAISCGLVTNKER